MIQNKHIINSLPLLAAALGKKYGVEVVIGGDTACTDGRTIYLPTLPQDCDIALLGLIRGYIDHESAHLRETDFNLLKTQNLSPLEQHIWNILEDWRVEHKLATVFPGCRQNLTWLIRHLFMADSEQKENQAVNADAMRILEWLLLSVRSWDVPELEPQCAKLAIEVDTHYPGLIAKLNRILQTVPRRCETSRECLNVAREMVRLLAKYVHMREQQEQKEASANSPESDTKSEANQNPHSPNGQSQNPQPQDEQSESQETQNPQAQNPQPQNPAENSRSENYSQTSESQNKQENSLQQLKNLINSLTDELPQSIGSIVAQKLGEYREIQRDGIVVATLGHKFLTDLDGQARSQAKSATNALRARLQGMLQARREVRERGAYRGKLDTRKLHRLSAGDARVFLARSIRQGLNTAVHILLDSSGSMCGGQIELACSACYAAAEAMRVIPGINLAVTAFPGEPMGPEQRTTVVPILKHGQKPHHQFQLSAAGSTPMDSALWWVLQQTLFLTETRKIILIISDGAPDNCVATVKAIRTARSIGCEVYGIGIGCANMQYLLPKTSQVISNIHKLAPAMFGMLQGALINNKGGV